MIERLRELYEQGIQTARQGRTNQKISEAYEQLFKTHEVLAKAIDSIEMHIAVLETLRNRLLDPAGKTNSQSVKDKWQVTSVDRALEYVSSSRLKLYEAIDNTLERPPVQ